jgi:uncharacterized membrane protein YeaQ/YmgE (transglycosylase-associated protein family)
MQQIGELAASLKTTLGPALAIVAGALLLLLGRRLYWLLAGVVGFVLAFVLVPRLLPEIEPDMALLVAIVAGVVGAVVVVFAHKVVLGLVGALAGALIAVWQAQSLGLEKGLGWLAVAILGGVIGAWLVSRVFEFALALLSALLGAQLLMDTLPVPERYAVVAYFGLIACGLVVQLVFLRRRRRGSRGAKD